MTLDDFVAKGWAEHADATEAVFGRLPDGVALLAEKRHHPSLAALVTHVCGEHLGRWQEGIRILTSMQDRPGFDAATPEGKAVFRSKAVLCRCANDREGEARWTKAARIESLPEVSDRIRILATAAAALLGQRRLREARLDLEEALRLAAYGPAANDPAARALAVTCNNMACELEVRAYRTPDETALMLRAAEAALTFWRLAGTWREESGAEYRLAMSHLEAGMHADALVHAKRALAIVEANGNEPGEAFFAREVLSRACAAAGDKKGARAERDAAAALLPAITDASHRSYCEAELAKLDASRGQGS